MNKESINDVFNALACEVYYGSNFKICLAELKVRNLKKYIEFVNWIEYVKNERLKRS